MPAQYGFYSSYTEIKAQAPIVGNWLAASLQVAQNHGARFKFSLILNGLCKKMANAAQARRLASVLKAADVPVTAFGARDTHHTKLNDRLGLPDDPATKALDGFLEAALKK